MKNTKTISAAQSLYSLCKKDLAITLKRFNNDYLIIAAEEEEDKGNEKKSDELYEKAYEKYGLSAKYTNLREAEKELIRHGLELIKNDINLDEEAIRKIKTCPAYMNKFIKITMSLDTSTLPQR